jgi:DNA-binding response OmpR family regulator
MTVQQRAGNIMVVDDQPENLKLLEGMLQRQGYTVRSFPRGRLALTSAIEQPPDLVLLDINMPEMSGYELCERLSCHERLSRIPVIFLSALDDVADKVRSFQAGGVDYITKPFQFDEVHARVRTHMLLSELRNQLRLRNEHIEELVQDRTREFAEANEQLKTLARARSELLRRIADELRTPGNGILDVCQLLMSALEAHQPEPELRAMVELSRRRMLTIIEDACMLTEIEGVPGRSCAPPSRGRDENRA